MFYNDDMGIKTECIHTKVEKNSTMDIISPERSKQLQMHLRLLKRFPVPKQKEKRYRKKKQTVKLDIFSDTSSFRTSDGIKTCIPTFSKPSSSDALVLN